MTYMVYLAYIGLCHKVKPYACEKVTSDFRLDVGVRRALRFPPPTSNTLLVTTR